MASIEGRKKVFLDRILAGDTQKEAAKYVNTPPSKIYGWMFTDPQFKLAYHEGRASALQAANERLEGLRPKAVNVVDRALDEGVDLKLSSDVALKLLRGQGVLVERGEMEHTGVIVTLTGDDLARIYLEARRAFLQDGREPVGLADGGGNGERPAAGGRADKVPAVAAPADSASGDRKE